MGVRQLVLVGPRELRLSEVPPPRPGPGQVRVAVPRESAEAISWGTAGSGVAHAAW
jgi:hypothetical protein